MVEPRDSPPVYRIDPILQPADAESPPEAFDVAVPEDLRGLMDRHIVLIFHNHSPSVKPETVRQNSIGRSSE